MPGWHVTLSVLSTVLISLPSSPSELSIEQLQTEDGWVILSKASREGIPISVGKLGPSIDQNERAAYGLFSGILGPRSYREPPPPGLLYPFLRPITGFESASFYEGKNGKLFMAIRDRLDGRTFTRIAGFKQRSLEKLIEHVGDDARVIPIGNQTITVTTSTDLDTIATRQRARVKVDGEVLNGRLIPVLEEGLIYFALADGSTRQLTPSSIEELTIRRSIIGQVAQTTFGKGLNGAVAGAAAGLFAGLSFEGLGAWEEMKFGATVGGIVGLSLGFLDGILSAEPSRTYTFTPVAQPESFELYLTMGF